MLIVLILLLVLFLVGGFALSHLLFIGCLVLVGVLIFSGVTGRLR